MDRALRGTCDYVDVFAEHLERLVAIRRESPEESGLILGRQRVAGEFKWFERLNLSDLASGIEGDEQANTIAYGSAKIFLSFINLSNRINLLAEYHIAAISLKVLMLQGFGHGESHRNNL